VKIRGVQFCYSQPQLERLARYPRELEFLGAGGEKRVYALDEHYVLKVGRVRPEVDNWNRIHDKQYMAAIVAYNFNPSISTYWATDDSGWEVQERAVVGVDSDFDTDRLERWGNRHGITDLCPTINLGYVRGRAVWIDYSC